MTPERWKQIDELVKAVLDHPPEARPAFLDRACNNDEALRREVELLISFDPQASSFLERPAFQRPSDAGSTPQGLQNPAVLRVLEDYLAGSDVPHPQELLNEESGELGDYRIIREIGRGGMGVVYEAEQVSLKRRVALKVLPFAAAMEDRSLERFKNEARAAAVLHHQHIVPVYSVGCDRGVHYYAMQLIEGRTLAATIRESRERSGLETAGDAVSIISQTSLANGSAPHLSEEPTTRAYYLMVARLGVQAATALDYAHQVGVVHRDIKPANLMLDLSGDLWVTDFGLAHMQSDTRLTMTGVVMGTLRYMSPEQALGNRVVDHRTDIYSLGVTLYELLTLGPVFAGEDRAELLHQIAFEEPIPPRRIAPVIPGELETIVLKAIAKNVEERYSTARELGDDLQRFIRDEPISARRPTLLHRTRKWARRHRAIVATAGVALAVLFVLALIGSLASNTLIKRERDLARTRLFDAKLAEVRTRRSGMQVGQRLANLQALTEAAQLARELKLGEDRRMEVRNETIACLALPDIRVIKEWEGWPAGSEGLAFDGAIELYAFSDAKGNISVRSIPDDQELARLPGEGPDGPNTAAPHIRFSPDGTLLVARHHQARDQVVNFRIWDWRLGKIVLQPSFTLGWFSVDFSPDGRFLALGRPDSMLAIYETATWNEVRQIKLTSPARWMAWSPDGRRVALIVSSGTKVEVRDLASGSLVCSWHNSLLVGQVAWSPDSAFLATGCEDGHVYVWESTTGQPHADLQGHTSFASDVQFSPRGDLLLSSGWDGTCRLWDPWTGREAIRIGGNAIFSKDGRRLVSRAGSNITIWEVASSEEYRAFLWSPVTGREEVRDGGGVSSDGRWLAVAAGDVFRLWDLKSGQALATLPTAHAVAATFHPSGNELFTSSHGGLYRWPWVTQAGLLRIGPAFKLPVDGYLEGISLDADGRTLSVARLGSSGGASVLDLESPSSAVRRVTHPIAAVSTSMSPDGRWVTTGVHKGLGVRVWEASSGRLVRELIPNEHNTQAGFSPDGKWLLTRTANEFCLWEVGSWERVRVQRPERGVDGPGSAAFTPDGKVLAITLSPSIVQLIEVDGWRPLARLHGPDPDPVTLQGFTPDGGRLIVARTAGGVHVWDLRLIRGQLQGLGLDWDFPPLPPEPPSGDSMPLRVEIQLGSFGRTQKR